MKKQVSQSTESEKGGKRVHMVLLCANLILAMAFLWNCRQGVNRSSDQASEADIQNFQPDPQKVPKQEVKTLQIGENAPDFRLPDIEGNVHALQDYSKYAVLVIVFTCNHCPTAQAYEQRLIDFTKDYSDKSVAVVAIMPNSAYGLLLEECGYSDLNDSWVEMKIRAEDKGFNFPYLYDGDDHAVSIQYGPVTTPHVFVFNKNRKLCYAGRIDDSEKPGTGNAEDLRRAADELLNGKPVSVPTTKTFGCSIKWAWKSEWTDKVNQEWEDKEVNLEWIDDNGIVELIANKGDKLRLINLWATWCAPCVTEFPEFVKIQRMYGNRDFEFISVSTDSPDSRNKALEFLQKNHAAGQNFIYSKQDKYRLIEKVDSLWGGALPYTLLVEPGGNVLLREQGLVDILGLKKTIVEHPLLGRYY